MADEKYFISANRLYLDSFRLAKQVLDDGFKPDFLIGIWRGGAPVGITVQDYVKRYFKHNDHISIRTSAYGEGINKQKNEIKVHALDYIVNEANSHNSLLIVDDVFDTGRSVQAVLRELEKKMRKNLPQDIRIAAPYWKPKKNKTEIKPDYHIKTFEAETWIVFPHELDELDNGEIVQKFFVDDYHPTKEEILELFPPKNHYKN